MQDGLPLPNKIANAPELRFGLLLFWEAFHDLHTCRNSAFGDGPISWITINDYCDRLGIDGEQRDDMHYHIREMDRVYLKYCENRAKS